MDGELLRQRDRRFAAPTFPADGLYFAASSTRHWPCQTMGVSSAGPKSPRLIKCPEPESRCAASPAGKTCWPRLLQAPTRSGWFSIRPARAP